MANTIVVEKKVQKSRLIKKARDTYWACYRWVRDLISPIWYSFFGYKHHIVKTKLTPSIWIDSDERMLYAVMAIVEWFVENDMMEITKKDFDSEIERIEKENYSDPEIKKYEIDSWTNQYNLNQKTLEVYKWWKNYPTRQEEISRALSDWTRVALKDGSTFKTMTEVEVIEGEKLCKHFHDLEDKLEDEEQEMLKLAVELRGAMWS